MRKVAKYYIVIIHVEDEENEQSNKLRDSELIYGKEEMNSYY